MFLNGAGGECVRLRNNAHGNTIVDSVIQYCGMYGKGDGEERAEYHNGEGVYIGTSPESDDQPMSDNDTSSNNVVARNIIRTFGSECFNVKENAHDNVFEDNVCSGNAESAEFEGSNVELRGYANVVRNNEISGQRRLLASRSRPTARSTTGAATSSRTTSSPEPRPRRSRSSQTRVRAASAATASSASGALFNADSDGTMPSGITTPPLLDRPAPARFVDSGNGRLRYRVNPGAATVQRWIPSSTASPLPVRSPTAWPRRRAPGSTRWTPTSARWPPAPYRPTTPRTPSAGAGSTRRPITAA